MTTADLNGVSWQLISLVDTQSNGSALGGVVVRSIMWSLTVMLRQRVKIDHLF